MSTYKKEVFYFNKPYYPILNPDSAEIELIAKATLEVKDEILNVTIEPPKFHYFEINKSLLNNIVLDKDDLYKLIVYDVSEGTEEIDINNKKYKKIIYSDDEIKPAETDPLHYKFDIYSSNIFNEIFLHEIGSEVKTINEPYKDIKYFITPT